MSGIDDAMEKKSPFSGQFLLKTLHKAGIYWGRVRKVNDQLLDHATRVFHEIFNQISCSIS
jgi:hypothetical protein